MFLWGKSIWDGSPFITIFEFSPIRVRNILICVSVATDTQIKMFLTRIGENSKIVINGDPSQIDLPHKNMSGLNRSKKLLGHLDEVSVIDFDHSDVVRHPLVSKIVKAYSDQEND